MFLKKSFNPSLSIKKEDVTICVWNTLNCFATKTPFWSKITCNPLTFTKGERSTLDSKGTTKVEGMSFYFVFKGMKVENSTTLLSLDLGGLEIWSCRKNETKRKWIKKYYEWTTKTWIVGECWIWELITNYSLEGPLLQGNEQK